MNYEELALEIIKVALQQVIDGKEEILGEAIAKQVGQLLRTLETHIIDTKDTSRCIDLNPKIRNILRTKEITIGIINLEVFRRVFISELDRLWPIESN